MSKRMRTKSQGPPKSPNIECDAGPFPNPDQVAKDQAEAVRLASIVTGGGRGSLVTDSQNTPTNSAESGEIPPMGTTKQVGEGDPQDTSKKPPNIKRNLVDGDRDNTTGDFLPGQGQDVVETEPPRQVTAQDGTPKMASQKVKTLQEKRALEVQMT